jgi:hypothetical protein
VDDRFLIQSGREIRTMEDWLLLAGPKEGIAQWAHGRSAMRALAPGYAADDQLYQRS